MCKQRVNLSFFFLKASAFDSSLIKTYLSLFFFVTFVNVFIRNFFVLRFSVISVSTTSAYHELFNYFFRSFFREIWISFVSWNSSAMKTINETFIKNDVVENELLNFDKSLIIVKFFSATWTIFKLNLNRINCYLINLSIIFLFYKHLNNVWWSIYNFIKNLNFCINHLIFVKFFTTINVFFLIIW